MLPHKFIQCRGYKRQVLIKIMVMDVGDIIYQEVNGPFIIRSSGGDRNVAAYLVKGCQQFAQVSSFFETNFFQRSLQAATITDVVLIKYSSSSIIQFNNFAGF